MERADLRHLLDRALATLPEAQRRTFVLHADAELSYREVAEVLGISIGTVMSRLYYGPPKIAGGLVAVDQTMKSPNGDRQPPNLLQIAAYLDGELDRQPQLAALRRRVHEWLLEHPEAGAAALAQRRLDRLMRATGTVEPSEETWQKMLGRLEELALQQNSPRLSGKSVRRISVAIALLATAAVLWLALGLWPYLLPGDPGPVGPGPKVELVKKEIVPLPPQERQQKISTWSHSQWLPRRRL